MSHTKEQPERSASETAKRLVRELDRLLKTARAIERTKRELAEQAAQEKSREVQR